MRNAEWGIADTPFRYPHTALRMPAYEFRIPHSAFRIRVRKLALPPLPQQERRHQREPDRHDQQPQHALPRFPPPLEHLCDVLTA
jgi:hypothetical protein